MSLRDDQLSSTAIMLQRMGFDPNAPNLMKQSYVGPTIQGGDLESQGGTFSNTTAGFAAKQVLGAGPTGTGGLGTSGVLRNYNGYADRMDFGGENNAGITEGDALQTLKTLTHALSSGALKFDHAIEMLLIATMNQLRHEHLNDQYGVQSTAPAPRPQ